MTGHRVSLEKTQFLANDYERTLPDHYRLIRMVGRGGMAEVFLAEDERLNRRVAIKFLNSEFRRNPDRMKRFRQEARAASALNHPNILIIHDIGESDGGQFIVSEYVEGETLNARIARGPVPIADAVDIAAQIASALAASHDAGILHRDIKPDNVMVRSDGSVKVLDFGLAKDTGSFSNVPDLEANTVEQGLTSPGLILGTPQYMSPEQARGRELDARSDLFSLGVLLFEMVTGRPPFKGESVADLIAAIISKDPPKLELHLENPPRSLVRIIEKALQKDRNERYASAEQMLSDLKELKRELASEAYPGNATNGTQVRTTIHNTDQAQRARFLHWEPVLLVLGVLLVGGFIWWYIGSNRIGDPAPVAALQSVPIASWSSGTGESVAAASFSPDAKMVAFAATRTGATEIWVKPVVGGDAVQVTKTGFYNQYPIWSPDGQELAFFSSRGDNHGIWRSAFTGGEQRQLIGGLKSTSRPVYWSSSGKIYFQEGAELYSVDEASAERRPVTSFSGRGVRPRMVEIAPDESKIVYSILEEGIWRVKVEDLAAADPRQIAESPDQIDQLAWEPDSRGVIFSKATNGSLQVFRAAADGSGSAIQISNGNADHFVQDIAQNGAILYGSVTETSDLWMAGADGGKESLVANDVAAEFWPDLSPDGKLVVFQAVKQTEKVFSGSIHVKPLAAGTTTLVSQNGFSPVWSHDGRSVAYFRRSEAGFGIWTARPGGDGAVKLVDGAVGVPGYTATPYLRTGVNHLSWAPDSKSIAYSAQTNGTSNIWLVSTDGTRNLPITDNKEPDRILEYPTWTADGLALVFLERNPSAPASTKKVFRLWLRRLENSEQKLVFESEADFAFLGLTGDGKHAVLLQKADPEEVTQTPGEAHVFLASLAEGSTRNVNTLRRPYLNNVHLSPDGASLAFVSRGENESALWTVPVNGGTPRKLLVENDPKVLISSLAWSPDGRSIVFGKQTRTNLLSMLAK